MRTPMSSDKNAMALYVSVVEAGSFSKATARDGMPVSTVSRKIAGLEKALGVRLLERSTRQLRMTDAGQDYFEQCRRVPNCLNLPPRVVPPISASTTDGAGRAGGAPRRESVAALVDL